MTHADRAKVIREVAEQVRKQLPAIVEDRECGSLVHISDLRRARRLAGREP